MFVNEPHSEQFCVYVFFIVCMFWVSKTFYSFWLPSIICVPKHSFTVPLFLHVNSLYILSFCCARFLKCRESATWFNICCLFGLLSPTVPDEFQHNFCDKIMFVFLVVRLQMYCPLRIASECNFKNNNLIKPCMDLIHSQRMSF